MTVDEETLQELRVAVSCLSDQDRDQVDAIATTLRTLVGATPLATIAIALVGAELAAST